MSHPPRSVARIDLEQARKQAKELLAAFRAADRRALETVRSNHPRFRKLKPAAFLAQGVQARRRAARSRAHASHRELDETQRVRRGDGAR